MELGRWGNQRTARIYTNTALLELAQINVEQNGPFYDFVASHWEF